ncbi:MAG: beta-ketoacyl-[acyl-carrier-protein] synthase family protein [Gammaproteobacteria bacterium]
MKPLAVTAYTTVNALGRGVAASLRALREERGALRPCDFEDAYIPTWIGRVEGLESDALVDELAAYDCRNQRLAQLGLRQDDFSATVAAAAERYGAERVGVFIGTSTSGVLSTEHAYRARDAGGALPAGFSYRHTHDIASVAEFTQRYLGLTGPAFGISTACSSSAKAFASAYHHLQVGFCDAAVVGGVDSLCLTTLYGFKSLELASSQPCRPWDVEREGLSLGEAASFALLEWPRPGTRGIALLGYGESSDAHHMSAAHPEGVGARQAMAQALTRAGLPAADIDYINLHGTATPSNDASEDKAVITLFGGRTLCSSTKGWTGHALGAAGALEAVFAFLCLEHGFIPASLKTRQLDPALAAPIVLATREQPVRTVLSNSFGFGGSNCSLLFGRLA